MKKIFAAALMTLCLMPTASHAANERVGSAAIGALAGGVVLGPVGAVAGAAIGFAAGPAIANTWSAGSAAPQRANPAAKPPRRNTAARQPVPLPEQRPDAKPAPNAKPAVESPASTTDARRAASEARAQAPTRQLPLPPARPRMAADSSAEMVPH